MGAIQNTIRSVRDVVRASLRRAGILKQRQYSKFDEEKLIGKYDPSIPYSAKTPFVVDIAASDGVSMSNTYALYRKCVPGLAVEFDDERFAKLSATYHPLQQVQLLKQMITPENVVETLEANGVPHNYSLLNLDIDGYDHFVLDAILGSAYRPTLICAEINEKIPPPLKFTVNYSPDYRWNVDHFFGQSISQLYELCVKYRYDLVDLHYNNAFLIPHELNTLPSLTPEQVYDRGYKNKHDRVRKFRYNHDMDAALTMSPEDAKGFIDKAFSKYKGQYTLS